MAVKFLFVLAPTRKTKLRSPGSFQFYSYEFSLRFGCHCCLSGWVLCVQKSERETHSGGVRCAVDDESVKPYMRLNEYRAGVRNQRRADLLHTKKKKYMAYNTLFSSFHIFCY